MSSVAKAIQAIYDRDGEVKASVVVDEASDEKSPLHKCFQWDDSEAAKEHRLWQARQLIKRVTIIVNKEEARLINVPITGGPRKEEGSYKPAKVIVHSQDEFERARDQLVKQLNGIQNVLDELESAAADRPELVEQISKTRAFIEQAAESAEQIQ